MKDGTSTALLTLSIGLALVALFGVMAALFPRSLARTRRAVDQTPGWCLGLGVVNAVFLAGVGLAFVGLADGLGAPVLRVPGLVAFSLLAIFLTFGLSAVAQLTGSRLFPQRSAAARVLLGGGMLTLASLTPFVGWFGVLPYAMLVGLGGFILSWFRKPAETDLPDPD
jgi:hypothetical protein